MEVSDTTLGQPATNAWLRGGIGQGPGRPIRRVRARVRVGAHAAQRKRPAGGRRRRRRSVPVVAHRPVLAGPEVKRARSASLPIPPPRRLPAHTRGMNIYDFGLWTCSISSYGDWGSQLPVMITIMIEWWW